MKNIFLTTLFIFLFNSVSAQKQEATLYFKDGTSINGLASFSQGFDRIRFREKKGAKRKGFTSETVDSLIIKEKKGFSSNKTYDLVHYHYKIVRGKSKPVLLKVLESGIVNLYEMKIKNSGSMHRMGSTKLINYVSKRNIDMVTKLGNYNTKNILFLNKHKKINTNNKKFKKRALYFFAGCPKLLKKIETNDFETILEIVKFYNKKCK